mmetsp:Transcript_33363/g.87512  ORF Transcript_33363/g.87512 Transcript_33363/m.87512 type:complete len:237 (+) Transcript_33363:3-713(+)
MAGVQHGYGGEHVARAAAGRLFERVDDRASSGTPRGAGAPSFCGNVPLGDARALPRIGRRLRSNARCHNRGAWALSAAGDCWRQQQCPRPPPQRRGERGRHRGWRRVGRGCFGASDEATPWHVWEDCGLLPSERAGGRTWRLWVDRDRVTPRAAKAGRCIHADQGRHQKVTPTAPSGADPDRLIAPLAIQWPHAGDAASRKRYQTLNLYARLMWQRLCESHYLPDQHPLIRLTAPC